MNAKQFAAEIHKITGCYYPAIDTIHRQCHVTLSNAYSLGPRTSSAIIEFEGSPPKGTIVVTGLGDRRRLSDAKSGPCELRIYIQGKLYRRGTNRHLSLSNLIFNFLEQNPQWR